MLSSLVKGLIYLLNLESELIAPLKQFWPHIVLGFVVAGFIGLAIPAIWIVLGIILGIVFLIPGLVSLLIPITYFLGKFRSH